jgi:hypothetical protein
MLRIIKTYNFTNIGCIENKIVKRLNEIHLKFDIEFTKILGQLKQKTFCRVIHDMRFQVIFKFNYLKI